MITKNIYKVPSHRWKKWQDQERMLFNSLLDCLLDNMRYFLHPEQPIPSNEHWRAMAWNVAWQAADELRLQRLAQ